MLFFPLSLLSSYFFLSSFLFPYSLTFPLPLLVYFFCSLPPIDLLTSHFGHLSLFSWVFFYFRQFLLLFLLFFSFVLFLLFCSMFFTSLNVFLSTHTPAPLLPWFLLYLLLTNRLKIKIMIMETLRVPPSTPKNQLFCEELSNLP